MEAPVPAPAAGAGEEKHGEPYEVGVMRQMNSELISELREIKTMQGMQEIELREMRRENLELRLEINEKLEVVRAENQEHRAENQSSHLELMTWLRTRFEGYVGQPLAAVRRASGQFVEQAAAELLPRRARAEERGDRSRQDRHGGEAQHEHGAWEGQATGADQRAEGERRHQ